MKKTMNIKLAVMTMLLAVFLIPATAQRGQGGGQGQRQGQGQDGQQRQRTQMTEENVKDRVNKLAESLELSEEQTSKILALELEDFKKIKAMRESFSGQQASQADREQMRAKMTESRELRETKYKEILNEEQYAKYIKQRDERRNSRQRPGDSQNQQGERPSRGRG